MWGQPPPPVVPRAQLETFVGARNKSRKEITETLSVDRLQLFPRLKAYSPSWRNGHFSAGARIAPDSSLARTHVEHSKSPQFNAIATGQRLLHALEDGLHGQLGLGLGDAGFSHHFINDVELNHKRLRVQGQDGASSD